jgi:hypothetical protein
MNIGNDTIGHRQPIVPHRTLLIAALALAALTLILHGSALQGFWRFDDPVILLYALKNPDVAGYFFRRNNGEQAGSPSSRLG